MNYLIKEKELKREKFINNLFLNSHLVMLPSSIYLIISYSEIKIISIIGFSIAIYCFAIGFPFVTKKCIEKDFDLENKIKETIKKTKEIEAIHISLDSQRDRMLFDGDNSYWEILQKLVK